MLFRDIRNNCRKLLNESPVTYRDRTGNFDWIVITGERSGITYYQFKIDIQNIDIVIEYDDDSNKAELDVGFTNGRGRSLISLICDPDLMRKVADFMEPLLDQNGKIDTEVLKRILAKNDL